MSPLADEFVRVTRTMAERLSRQGQMVDETPIRIHSHETDAGHGLGGPRFSAEFLRYIGAICDCNRPPQCAPGCRADRSNAMRHLDDCDKGCPHYKFRPAMTAKRNPLGLSRAFRQLRAAAPAEFDITYLVWSRGLAFIDARDQINTGRYARGQEAYTDHEITCLYIAGTSKVAACI